MRERFWQREIPATEAEIRQAVEGWWSYLDAKKKVRPHLVEGIVTGLIETPPSEASRTVRFSLDKDVAPELSGFGRLVNAKIPHVYVEGTRNSNIRVRLDEILYRGSLWPRIFRTDVENIFSTYLHHYWTTSTLLDRFLLYIYTANDFEQYGKTYESPTVREMVFTTTDEKIHAYDLEGGWRSLSLEPLVNKRVHIDKSMRIKPATQRQIAIVQESFRNEI